MNDGAELPATPDSGETIADRQARADIEALRGGPVDLERELVRGVDDPAAAPVDTIDDYEELPPGEPGGYFETAEQQGTRIHAEAEAAIDLSRLDTIRVRTPFEEEVEDAFDEYELEQAPRDTTIERIVAAHEAVLAFRTDQTPEATGAPTTPVIPSAADSIAAVPRRPRTLEDEKAATGYSTSGSEADIIGRTSSRQPR